MKRRAKTGVEGFDGRLENPATKGEKKAGPTRNQREVNQPATTKMWLYHRHIIEIPKGNPEGHFDLNVPAEP